MSHLRELKLEVECDECARKDRVIRQYAENHSKLVEEVSAAHEVARAAGKEVTKLKGQLTKQHNESARLEQVERVVEYWRGYRPKASKAFGKPGVSKSFAIIEKALVLMAEDPAGPVDACCEAIDGLHLAPYQEYDRWYATDGPKRTLRNGVQYALGDEERIERCRAMARLARNVSVEAKLRAYETAGQVYEAWSRALMGELWGQKQEEPEVDGIVVRADA